MKRLLLTLALLLLAAPAARGAIALEGSTDSLELVTSAAGSIDYTVTWSNVTATALTTPGTTKGNITGATTTPILAAPSASNWRYVRVVTLYNASTTVANTLTLQVDVSATKRRVGRVTLEPGGYAILDEYGRLNPYTASGVLRTQSPDAGFNGKTYSFQKVGTAKDAAGYWILGSKDAGFPGAWVLGAPGLNGANFDCSTAAGATVAGSHLLQSPASGNLYLTQVTIAGSVAETIQLIDLIWYNTGLAATTTTIQAVTTAAFPARDINGSTNGEGIEFALYAVAALGNAAAVANTTINYTDESGNTGSVGTFSALVGWQAPATPLIGTFMPFQLAAGDRGVRALDNAAGGGITLGTSYVSGTMSAIAYRPLVTIGNAVVNNPTTISIPAPGIRVYPGSCISVLAMGSASASTLAGSYTIVER